MIHKFIILLCVVIAFAGDTPVLAERGTGISDGQLSQINYVISVGRKLYGTSLYDLASYIKGDLQKLYGKNWLVEIASGTNLVHGTAGAYYTDDQWVKLTKQNGTIFYWISVPALTRFHHYDLPAKENFIAKRFFENQKNFKSHGSGISSSQQKAIENMMRNAQLSKGNHPQACANLIEQKLQDSFGQNWIVEIYGSDNYDLNWGRALLKYKDDQWLFYSEFGSFTWQYLIWVPGY